MPGSNNPLPRANGNAQEWPGQRLGLPRSGPRSIARLGRRIGALSIDWAIAYGIAWALFQDERRIVDGLFITSVFLVMQIASISLTSGSIGHVMLGMRVVPMVGGWVGVWRPIVRTVLLCVVIPAVIWDADQRGMHDRLAGTVLVIK